ncbi:hypothetical protein CLU79DRAFT_733818 [Phycomyces nitens]|nr:hypothetical protein CLU79DRAFT_733818 [Phycomyces nitens]
MLPSVGAYELHYEARHLNTCSVCEKVFPSAHWLQLHLDECHDVLKKIQKERGEKIYACYVEGCQKHFMEPKLRRLHLVDKHHYPKYFPFDIVLTGSLNYDQWKKHEKRQKTINKHHKAEELPIKGESEPVDIDMDDLTDHLKRLKIPKTISFGRGAKASLSRHLPHANSSTNLPIDDCVNVQEDTTMDISIVEDNNSTRPRRKRGPKKKKNTPATTL